MIIIRKVTEGCIHYVYSPCDYTYRKYKSSEIYIAYIDLAGIIFVPDRKHLKLPEAQTLVKGVGGIEFRINALLYGLYLKILVALPPCVIKQRGEKALADLMALVFFFYAHDIDFSRIGAGFTQGDKSL